MLFLRCLCGFTTGAEQRSAPDAAVNRTRAGRRRKAKEAGRDAHREKGAGGAGRHAEGVTVGEGVGNKAGQRGRREETRWCAETRRQRNTGGGFAVCVILCFGAPAGGKEKAAAERVPHAGFTGGE